MSKRKAAKAEAARGGGRRRAGLAGSALALLVLTCAGAPDDLRADTIVLKSGEVLEGSIIDATRNTVIVEPAIGGMRLMALRDIREVRIDLARGQSVSGQLLSWADGVYQVRSGDQVVRVSEDGVLSREPGEMASGEPQRDPPQRPAGPQTVRMAAAPAPAAPAETAAAPPGSARQQAAAQGAAGAGQEPSAGAAGNAGAQEQARAEDADRSPAAAQGAAGAGQEPSAGAAGSAGAQEQARAEDADRSPAAEEGQSLAESDDRSPAADDQPSAAEGGTPSPEAGQDRSRATAQAPGAAAEEERTLAALGEDQAVGERQGLAVKASVEPAAPGAGQMVFRIELSRPADQTVVLIYGTVEGTAKAGEDFEPRQGMVTLAPGTKSAEVHVPLLEQATAEGEKRFELFLAADPKVAEVVDKRIIATINGVE